jgi:hypothetical protein
LLSRVTRLLVTDEWQIMLKKPIRATHSRGVDRERELTREPSVDFRLGALLPTQECMTTLYPG